MASAREDQAAGLRRLVDHAQLQIIAFVSGSADPGKNALVANLAATLTQRGKRVLVLDEPRQGGVAAYYGHQAHDDLLSVLNAQKKLSEVLLNIAHGLCVLPVGRMTKALNQLSARQQTSLLACFAGFDLPIDIILVNASTDHALGFSPFGLVAQDTVIVISPSSASITDAYALIKKVSLSYAHKNFRILVNNARNFDEAAAIYNNLATVTHQRDLAQLTYAGFVPFDEFLSQAAQHQQAVCQAFPVSPAAQAYRSIADELSLWLVHKGSSSECTKNGEQFVRQLLSVSKKIDLAPIYA